MPTRFLSRILVCVSLVALSGTGFAGKEFKPTQPPARESQDSLNWLLLKSSYTFESDFERGRNASGSVLSYQAEYNHRIPLSLDWPQSSLHGQWYLRLGVDYRRWDFDHEGGLPLPNHLQSASGIIAIEYVVQDTAAMMLELRPGVYFEDDIDSDTFDIPVRIYAPIWWHESDRVSWAFLVGASYAGLRSYPIIPAAGLVVKYDKWTLFAVPPQPRLAYAASDRLTIWAEGEVAGGAFRTDAQRFDRKPELNDAVVTYSEWRASLGFTLKTSDSCMVDVGAGWAFQRKFDFHRAEEGFETDEGAPFVKVELRGSF